MKWMLALFSAFILTSQAEPLKIMVIGDSQSEEYRFEIPFSAPESDPTEANTMNWIEILSEHRTDDFDFGEYKNNAFEWLDVRNAGYEYNWSIPGALTETWVDVLNASLFQDQEFLASKLTLLGQVDEMDAVVIFLGGNDMSTVYSRLNRDERPPNWPEYVIDQVDEIAGKIREKNSSVPILIGTFPDVGGTTKRQNDFPEKAGRDLASIYIAEANTKLQNYADSQNFPVFDVAQLTLDLINDAPIRFGNVQLLPSGHPENKARYLLCRDGFHPSTSSQVIIANGIIGALNQALNSNLEPFTDEEILVDILGLDPNIDDDYLTWINAIVPEQNSLLADPDGDGLENLGEYALDTDPLTPDMPQITRNLTFSYLVEPTRTTYVETSAAESDDLANWFLIPDTPPITLARPFLRLEFSLPH